MHASEITIPIGKARLDGTLTMPRGARGIVAFAHGSGSSRFSPRNRAVAQTLVNAGLATLLFDLLDRDEEDVDNLTALYRFDIDLLARRLSAAIGWIRAQPACGSLPIGLFGASTGAAAALVAAAREPAVGAVVSRGGRPDLAGDALERVVAPTLLIVGARDEQVLHLNRLAAARLTCETLIEIVPGATHLFEEPGALDAVARLAAGWFVRWLAGDSPAA
ncbi:dienelactone hydrolase family protein [Burkholderia ubonensis]|uniref:dienelactone hydrolase family protein n=1 Tax=Burkholderia ubonensis TaxID=101571 RepID=UPI000F5825D7|nr:dienelactone hydrolase family protein [Burkholderia ubonensis]RQP27043.1 alpha/beta hydrolase [Burkholderia ubonensis]RQP28634.1 alpha/beta hydrolase [Burkholderia ubonensis]RQP29533.1 alpha/beta hydrolase [Burkholderia ubonensis]RQP45996.1 alpha/beta hydrolase [Burkholderia ubonensis]RQP48800.1 alpha/beta hydrolase [Burkholderia ubonensis]